MTEKVVATYTPTEATHYRVEYRLNGGVQWFLSGTYLDKEKAVSQAKMLTFRYGHLAQVVEVTND
jgi:hypothetical protein